MVSFHGTIRRKSPLIRGPKETSVLVSTICLCSALFGEDSQLDKHIFQTGWKKTTNEFHKRFNVAMLAATTFESWRSMRQDQHDLTGEIYFAIFAFYVTRTVFFLKLWE